MTFIPGTFPLSPWNVNQTKQHKSTEHKKFTAQLTKLTNTNKIILYYLFSRVYILLYPAHWAQSGLHHMIKTIGLKSSMNLKVPISRLLTEILGGSLKHKFAVVYSKILGWISLGIYFHKDCCILLCSKGEQEASVTFKSNQAYSSISFSRSQLAPSDSCGWKSLSRFL